MHGELSAWGANDDDNADGQVASQPESSAEAEGHVAGDEEDDKEYCKRFFKMDKEGNGLSNQRPIYNKVYESVRKSPGRCCRRSHVRFKGEGKG